MRESLLRNFRFDHRSLGLFRILTSLVLIGDWLVRWGHVPTFYTAAGVFPNALRFQLSDHSLGLLPLDWTDSVPAVRAIFVVGLVCYLMLLIGLRTRLFCLLSLIFWISMGQRNDLVLIGADQVLSTMLVWAAFLPLGKRFSVDALLSRRRRTLAVSPGDLAPHTVGEQNTIFSIAGFAAVVQIAVIYFCTAVVKSGVTWQDGTAMYYTMHMDQSNQPLALWLRELPLGMLKAFTWSALALEYAAAPMILSPWGQPYARRVIIILLAMMHLAIAVTLKAGAFSYTMMATYSLLLGGEDWRLLGRWGQRMAGWPVVRRFRRLSVWASAVEQEQDRSSLLTRSGATAGLSSSVSFSPENTAGQASSGTHISDERLFQRAARYVIRRAGADLASGVALLLLATALVTAFNANIAPRLSWGLIRTPGAVDWIVAQLGTRQQWNMFAPDAPRNDGWWVIDGRKADGQAWDPLTGAEPRFEKPPRSQARHNVLWRSYLKRVWLRPEDVAHPRIAQLRQFGGRYFAGRTGIVGEANAGKPETLKVFYVQEFTREPGQQQPFATQTMHLGSYDSGTDQYLPGTRPVLWTYWHADGVRAMEGEFQGGKKSGTWKQWDGSGVLREVGQFRGDVPHGQWTLYHPDGKQESGPYQDGQKHGLWTTKHANGRQESGAYEHDQKHGPWTYKHANGSIAEQGNFRRDLRHGVWKRWDSSGHIRLQSELSNDVPHGLTIAWDERGQKTKQGEYDRKQAVGPWAYWHPNGQQAMTGSYRAGVKIGQWQTWYPNGRRESAGAYSSGRKDGKWTFWSEDGSQSQEVVFKDGRQIGAVP